jgi:hypothetical protein
MHFLGLPIVVINESQRNGIGIDGVGHSRLIFGLIKPASCKNFIDTDIAMS